MDLLTYLLYTNFVRGVLRDELWLRLAVMPDHCTHSAVENSVSNCCFCT